MSVSYTEHLEKAGLEASVGSVGSRYNDALAESVIGLFKTKVIRHNGPWRTMEAVEWAVLKWVHWYNNQRLLSSVGYVPPVEYREMYHQEQEAVSAA